MNFVHLHVHTQYSLLDGMAPVQALVDKAISMNMPALAITDHGNMFAIKEFLDYVKKKNASLPPQQHFKPIVGCELYVARRSRLNKDHKVTEDRGDKTIHVDEGGEHLIALAKDLTGYYNLCRMVSLSWIEGFYYRPRVDKELLEKYHQGLIICSACLGGEIHRKIQANKLQQAQESVMWFKQVFGDDYYLEFQLHPTGNSGGNPHVYERQRVQNVELLKIARATNTKIIVSNDVHFVEAEHADAHERLICVGTGKDMDTPDRMAYTKQEWLKSAEEMQALFPDIWEEAAANTIEIADKVQEYDICSSAIMPQFPIPAEFGTIDAYREKHNEQALRQEFGSSFDKLGDYEKVLRIKLEADYLNHLTLQGAARRYADITPDIIERINFELDTLKTMGFPGYFLIVRDLIEYARSIGVAVGPGRGSAAGSVVAYCLRITDIDPFKFDLLFERFLNPDRISMPDIDIDFDEDGRSKVYDYVVEKYGKNKVAHIITFGTMAAKSAIKDVARVQKLPLSEAEKLSKLIPYKFDAPNEDKKVNIGNCIEYVPEIGEAYNSPDPNIASTIKYAAQLEGTVRQTGVHACGVIIGADDLINYIPLSTADDKNSGGKIVVTQYEGSSIEDVGLIKMDFLGLTTLSVVKDAIRIIKENKGVELDIDHIPDDDPATYDLFGRGATTGIFQFESAGMRKYMKELKPTCLDDLIAMNALYRPGPLKYIPQYIARKHGREQVTYPFPEMESRLKETYGITVYQEQVMLLSRDMAGFSRGEADTLRKAMGKKMLDKMNAMRKLFMSGAKISGFNDDAKLQQIWDDWAEFSKYAFNKSHAAGYSWLAYQTAYIKAHFPAEFMAASLGRMLSNTSEIAKLMNECKLLKIRVFPPDINQSGVNFNVAKDGNIRFGLAAIKGVGEHAAEVIVKSRTDKGAYSSIYDMMERVPCQIVNKRVMEALAGAGALDCFGIGRPSYFVVSDNKTTFVDALLKYGSKHQEEKASGQQSMFGEDSSSSLQKPLVPKVEQYNHMEFLNKEKELVGIYLSAHPLDEYKDVIKAFATSDAASLQDLSSIKTSTVTAAGRIAKLQHLTSKAGNAYGKLTLEDYSGMREWSLVGSDYKTYGARLKEGDFCMITAAVQEKYSPQTSSYAMIGLAPSAMPPKEKELKITRIEPLSAVRQRGMRSILLYVPAEKVSEDFIEELSAAVGVPEENPDAIAIELFLLIYDMKAQLKVRCRSSTHKAVLDDPLWYFMAENELTHRMETIK